MRANVRHVEQRLNASFAAADEATRLSRSTTLSFEAVDGDRVLRRLASRAGQLVASRRVPVRQGLWDSACASPTVQDASGQELIAREQRELYAAVLQVAEYDLGGYYKVSVARSHARLTVLQIHNDFSVESALYDRGATLITYLTDTARGGETAFPYLR